jgi:hypothetical protein
MSSSSQPRKKFDPKSVAEKTAGQDKFPSKPEDVAIIKARIQQLGTKISQEILSNSEAAKKAAFILSNWIGKIKK